jgi:hypothetical protein
MYHDRQLVTGHCIREYIRSGQQLPEQCTVQLVVSTDNHVVCTVQVAVVELQQAVVVPRVVLPALVDVLTTKRLTCCWSAVRVPSNTAAADTHRSSATTKAAIGPCKRDEE